VVGDGAFAGDFARGRLAGDGVAIFGVHRGDFSYK